MFFPKFSPITTFPNALKKCIVLVQYTGKCLATTDTKLPQRNLELVISQNFVHTDKSINYFCVCVEAKWKRYKICYDKYETFT